MSIRDSAADPKPPRVATSLRQIGSSALVGSTLTSFLALAFIVFVAFEQDQWSPRFFANALSLLQLGGGAWALIIHTPLWLLVERRGWNRYLAMVIEAVMAPPAVALALAVTGALTKENFIAFAAIALVPVLLVAGIAGLAAKHDGARKYGGIVWLMATAVALVVWLLAAA